jgi:serine/threonine protein kinase
MGEVYRAHDTKLNRDVALKVLPPEFAGNPERMGRFKREAQLLASLNHTSIAAIYGLEECNGVSALIMELAEGATLADRISHGPIALDEALSIAWQIAEALEAAHERGIIHRDLKPANVKVTPEGIVKVLDFGLAKALEGEAKETDGSSNSPTLTATATEAGVILGTAAYMSPEQARGSPLDKRCDIWSFGVVLFEMLSGKKLFAGKTIADTLAAVLRAETDWNILPGDTPASIRTLLRRCLTKEPKQRLQAIGEARIAIAEYLADPKGASVPETVAVADRHKLRESVGWSIAIVFILATLTLGVLYFRQVPAEAPETRLEVVTPPTSEPSSLAISPDGSHLTFVASTGGQPRLWLRPLGVVASQPLPGTEGATYPFWSADSKSIGFFAGDKLKRIDIAGGSPQVLASAPFGLGGAWNGDGVIVFAPSPWSPLYRVPASGGDPIAITRLDSTRRMACVFPQFLPDGRHLLFLGWGTEQGIYLASLDSAETRRLIAGDAPATYAAPGYLLFTRQGTLFAQRFDAKRGQLTGDPVSVADDVLGFSVSKTGMLAYRTAGGANHHQLAWFDRAGKEAGTIGAPDANDLLNPELSPDGRRVAVWRTVQGNEDLWLIDTERGVPRRFTFDPASDGYPIWSPDGSRIAFGSDRKGAIWNLYQKASSSAGGDELLLESSLAKFPRDWSMDGRFLLFVQVDPRTLGDLWVLPLFGERKPFPFVNTSFQESHGQFSPDCRWVAYISNESGRFEVYVQPFPGPGGEWQVSTGGGIEPRWRRDGKELFYIAPDSKLMAVPIQGAGQTLEAGAPVALFQTRIVGGSQNLQGQQYAVAPDGQRFLINTAVDEATASPITIVTNWARALKK